MLILELAERDLLTKMQQSVIEIDQAESIIQDLLRALSDIHKQGFVHRNIDPSNIVFTHTHKLKVIDFGRAEFLGHQQSLSTTELNLKHPSGYQAPQLILKKSHNTSVDIWSAGCVFFQLFFNKVPFDITSASSYINDIRSRCVENGRYSLPQQLYSLHTPEISLSLEHFFSLVFQMESGNRPSAQELLRHQIFLEQFSGKLKKDKSQTNKTARIDSRLQPTHLSQMSNYAKTVSEVSCVDYRFSQDYFKFKFTYLSADNFTAFDDDYFRKKVCKFKCLLLVLNYLSCSELMARLKVTETKSKNFIEFKKLVQKQTKDIRTQLEYSQYIYFELYPNSNKIPHFKQFYQYEKLFYQECTQLAKAALILSEQESLTPTSKTNLLIVSLRITLLFIINFRSVYCLRKLPVIKDYLVAHGQLQLNAERFNTFLQSLYITKVVQYLTDIQHMCRQN